MLHPTTSEERLRAVSCLFAPSNVERRHLFRFSLESTAVELGRLLSIDPFPLAGIPADRAQALVSATFYASSRLNDFLLRQSFISWLRSQFTQHGQYPSGLWRAFGALAIKDFHADVSSAMDSVAPVAILIDTDIKKDDLQKLPGFPDIQKCTKRSYRKFMQADLLAVVDSTEDWWPFVKELRDVAMHREHQRFVFGSPEDGFLFQIYHPGDAPLVTQPLFSSPGTDVADFLLYAAWVTAEVVSLLDRLAAVLSARLSLTPEALDTGGRVGNFSEFLDGLQTLIARISGQPGRAQHV
jgi:hypothetical protein